MVEGSDVEVGNAEQEVGMFAYSTLNVSFLHSDERFTPRNNLVKFVPIYVVIFIHFATSSKVSF